MTKAIVKEGQAEIVFPSENEVFYNPVQEFNRDLTIAMINQFSEIYLQEKKDKKVRKSSQKSATIANENNNININNTVENKVTIFEGLSATGLRSIRFAKEIKSAGKVIANDFDPVAVEFIKRNVEHNQIENIVEASQGDANYVMYKSMNAGEKSFDVIDLDPYGTAAPFIDAAIRSVANGGLLCVTCTDMAVLAGGQTESCFAKYGGTCIPNAVFCHELALRILFNLIQSTAARYEKYIEPLASFSIDFYVRVFVRIHHSPQERKKTASKTSVLYYCHGCKSFNTQQLGKVTVNGKSIKYGTTSLKTDSTCLECGGTYHLGGPFYSGLLHNKEFLQKSISYVKDNKDNYKTHERMLGMLTVAYEEIESLLYYTLPSLSNVVRSTTPSLKPFVSALLNQGYDVSASHACPASIKTNASTEVVWDVMRSFIKEHPVKAATEDEPRFKILQKEIKTAADFTLHKNCEPESRKVRMVRYQENPTANWGPKARAGTKKRQEPSKSHSDEEKEILKTKKSCVVQN